MRAIGGAAIAGKPWGTDTGNRSDDAGSVDHSNAAVHIVGNVKVAGGVSREGRLAGKLRTDGRAAIAGITGRAIAGNRADDSASRDLSNAIVATICEKEISGSGNRHAGR